MTAITRELRWRVYRCHVWLALVDAQALGEADAVDRLSALLRDIDNALHRIDVEARS